MKVEIKVPAMGESISEATVGNILKPSGSSVKIDDEILELETDKVNQVLYAPQSGVLHLNVSKDQNVKIGDLIGFIETEEKSQEKEMGEKKKPPEASKGEPKVKEAAASKPKEPERIPALEPPAASPSRNYGSRLTKETFLAEAASNEAEEQPPSVNLPPANKPEPSQKREGRETRRKMSRIRKVIAERLVESQRSTAMLTTFNEVDMTQVMNLREKYKETFSKEYGVRLGLMSFFLKAAVFALESFPELNSYIDGDEIVHREYYDIGVAVGTDKGLFVPVVRNCDQLSFAEIEAQIEALAKKAKEGTISVDDLQGAGFTITNGGVYGSLLSTPILNPPQSGILGMHKIIQRPIVVADQIVARPMMYLALSYDHRIVDGKEAVSFLIHVKNHLEDPARFLLDI